jgi:2-keto-4-pentenoate hydratase/2-oxohepta-3-ene-1,7-dioic acid hydratase in catechol pathway
MKIICIGRNYEEHAKELNNPVPEEPVFFMKPETSLVLNNRPFFYPDFTSDLHHEVEIVLRISRVGKHIDSRFAHRYYDEIGLGVDFTARDVQAKAKAKGLPWEKAKAFDGSAPLGKFMPKNTFARMDDIDFHLEINGETVQQGNTRDMLFSFDEIIAHISKYITLKIGDLIYTGTPSGVGPVKTGDRLTGFLGEQKMFSFLIK